MEKRIKDQNKNKEKSLEKMRKSHFNKVLLRKYIKDQQSLKNVSKKGSMNKNRKKYICENKKKNFMNEKLSAKK